MDARVGNHSSKLAATIFILVLIGEVERLMFELTCCLLSGMTNAIYLLTWSLH